MAHRLLFIVNVDWFFLSHRLPIALAAQRSGYEVHVATRLTDQLAEMESHGLIVHPLDLDRGGANLRSTWRSLLGMLAVIKQVRPALVHLVTIKPVLLGGLAARIRGVPAVVAAVSGLGFVFLARGVRAALLRWLIGNLYRLSLGHRNIIVVFQNSEDLQVVTKLARLPRGAPRLIRGSGVDLDEYRATPEPVGPPVVLLGARLLSDKGVREFVEAASLLRVDPEVERIGARFVLAGEQDPDNPASLTQAELDAWQLAGTVELWGHREDMPETLAAADIVVLPSYREGLPRVLIEAAACGRPVVTTDVPGCRDAIEPGETGLLVRARDTAALASAIKRLLLDPAMRRRMGAAGRALAVRAFDVRDVARSHLEIYDTLLKARQ